MQRFDIWQRAHSPDRNLVFCCTCESSPKCRGCGPQSAKTVTFPQIWSVLSSSSHKSLLGLNRTFSSVVWHGSLVHPYHWTLKLRGPLLPPRAAEEMGVRKIWRKCRGTCVRPRWIREGLGEPGGGKGEHGRRQSKSRAALVNAQRRGVSRWWGFLNFKSLPFDFYHCLKENFLK